MGRGLSLVPTTSNSLSSCGALFPPGADPLPVLEEPRGPFPPPLELSADMRAGTGHDVAPVVPLFDFSKSELWRPANRACLLEQKPQEIYESMFLQNHI